MQTNHYQRHHQHGWNKLINHRVFSIISAAKAFKDSCVEDGQCNRYLKGSICTNGSCNCPTGFNADHETCIRRKGSCTTKSECIFSKDSENLVACVGGVCTCLFKTSSDGKVCVLAYESNSAVNMKNGRLPLVSFLTVAGVGLLLNINIL